MQPNNNLRQINRSLNLKFWVNHSIKQNNKTNRQYSKLNSKKNWSNKTKFIMKRSSAWSSRNGSRRRWKNWSRRGWRRRRSRSRPNERWWQRRRPSRYRLLIGLACKPLIWPFLMNMRPCLSISRGWSTNAIRTSDTWWISIETSSRKEIVSPKAQPNSKSRELLKMRCH